MLTSFNMLGSTSTRPILTIYFTAQKLHAKSRPVVSLSWVHSDVPRNNRGINDVLFYPIGIRITFKNLLKRKKKIHVSLT